MNRSFEDVVAGLDTTPTMKDIIRALHDPEVENYEDVSKKTGLTIAQITNATYKYRLRLERELKFGGDGKYLWRVLGKKGKYLRP